MRNKILKPSLIISTIAMLLAVVLGGCQENFQPKPRAYFRIALPEKAYVHTADTLPYSFDIPVYASLIKDPEPGAEASWTNLNFNQFNAKLHLSYKNVNNNLPELLNDAYKLVNKHIPKANAINEKRFVNPEKHVYGVAYTIQGSDAASPFQFYVTDSTQHFLRGALYFNVRPNNDSLAPVIDFLSEDILHMIETLEWNKN